MRSKILKGASALLLALIGAAAGGMLTTSYKNLRSNGASYLPALSGGFRALVNAVTTVVQSPWFLLPVGAVIIVLLTIRLTVRAMKPKDDPYKLIGYRMVEYANAAQHDQQHRRFRIIYNDTLRICHEIEAFIVEVQLQGIPVPAPQSFDAEAWIDVCRDYFTAVGPYLRSGNVTYALGTAQSFADRYPPQRR